MSNSASYDKALLDDAPELSREQRQRFYDADLLYDDPNQNRSIERQRTASDPNAAALPAGAAPARSRSVHPRPNNDLDAGNTVAGGRNKEYAPLPAPVVSRSKAPWYKTRAGIIGLVILASVIVGAVVGGAVGGTQANKNKSSSSPSTTASTLPASMSVTTTSNAEAGQGVTSAAPAPGGTTSSSAAEAPVGNPTTAGDAPAST